MTHDGAAKIGPLQWPRQWCGFRNAVCGRPSAVYTLELCHPLCAALLTCSSAALASRSRSRDHTQEIASSFPVSFVSFSTSSHFVFCHSPSPFSPPSPSCSRRISTLSCPPLGCGLCVPSKSGRLFSLLRFACSASRTCVPATATFHTAKNRRPFAPPRVRDSLSLASTAPARLSIEFDDAPAAQLCSALPARLFNSSAALAVVALPPVTMQTVPSVSLLTFPDGTRHT